MTIVICHQEVTTIDVLPDSMNFLIFACTVILMVFAGIKVYNYLILEHSTTGERGAEINYYRTNYIPSSNLLFRGYEVIMV